MQTGATFSWDRKHRFVLWRIWEDTDPKLVIIGLNPSTADATTNDATIRRCISFAERDGYGGLIMLNLFSWRSTDPAGLLSLEHRQSLHTAHRENLRYFRRTRDNVIPSRWVAAWGANRLAAMRFKYMQEDFDFPPLYCFGLTKDDAPKHPLRLASITQIIRMQ